MTTTSIRPTTITFIGFGEAGSLIASGLLANHRLNVKTWDRLLDDPTQSQVIVSRAKTAGVEIANSMTEAIAGSELIFSTVTADQCVNAARAAQSSLSADQCWLDLNSTSPMAKQEAAAFVTAAGASYVDVAVMANVPPKGHRVPILLAGASATDATNTLNELGMDASVVGDQIGQAATIKMCRSVFLKGFDAILLECLSAAELAGVREAVINSIDASFPDFDLPAKIDGRVRRVSQHSKRRAAEMRDVSATVEQLGQTATMARATADLLERLASSNAADAVASDAFQLQMLPALLKS